MRKTTLAGATLAFCSPRQGRLPGVVQWVTCLSSCPGATTNSCEQLQAPDHAPRQS